MCSPWPNLSRVKVLYVSLHSPSYVFFFWNMISWWSMISWGGGGLTSALYGGRKAKEEDLKKYLQEESNKTYKLENKEGWQWGWALNWITHFRLMKLFWIHCAGRQKVWKQSNLGCFEATVKNHQRILQFNHFLLNVFANLYRCELRAAFMKQLSSSCGIIISKLLGEKKNPQKNPQRRLCVFSSISI